MTPQEKNLLHDLETNAEIRDLVVRHYFRAEAAKQLMRAAGYGVTGTDILETTKLMLSDIPECH